MSLTIKASDNKIFFADGDGSITLSTFRGKNVVKLTLESNERLMVDTSDPLILYSNSGVIQLKPEGTFESVSGTRYSLEAYYSGNVDLLSKRKINKVCVNTQSGALNYNVTAAPRRQETPQFRGRDVDNRNYGRDSRTRETRESRTGNNRNRENRSINRENFPTRNPVIPATNVEPVPATSSVTIRSNSTNNTIERSNNDNVVERRTRTNNVDRRTNNNHIDRNSRNNVNNANNRRDYRNRNVRNNDVEMDDVYSNNSGRSGKMGKKYYEDQIEQIIKKYTQAYTSERKYSTSLRFYVFDANRKKKVEITKHLKISLAQQENIILDWKGLSDRNDIYDATIIY